MSAGRAAAWTVAAVLACALVGCSSPEPAPPVAADDRVTALADAYLGGYFERYPDQVTVYGVTGGRHHRLPDNSLAAVVAWRGKEDAWLAESRAIDADAIQSRALRATYAIVREALEASAAVRVCRQELWPVSQMTGWHVSFSYLATIQPVGSTEDRQAALDRWHSLPRYLDTEIDNLRRGIREGFTTPRGIVTVVIDQLRSLIEATRTAAGPGATPSSDGDDASPFHSPQARDHDAAFREAYGEVVRGELLPAFDRYLTFLEREYRAATRESIAVAALPDGRSCYDALVRQHSSLPMAAADIHALGQRQMDRLMTEMRVIAERSFQTDDVRALLARLRTDRRYTFRDREDLIGYTRAALDRAKSAAPRWFGRLPRADVAIEPYPPFREKNGANEYNPPAEDGSRPGLFYISAYQPEKTSRAVVEATAFHETIPGHHLQTALALEGRDNHPIGRYLYNSGYAEGWGLYAERLADEMQLYSGDLDRIGMLASQALRAARLVVDSGLHTQGWSRQQALEYLLAHTAEAPDYLASEVDRYIVWPGQATSYMLGMFEIRRARDEATARLGSRFSLTAFHDRVLEDGGVPLTFLAAKLRALGSDGGAP